VHTYPGQQAWVYEPLLGYSSSDSVSIQTSPNSVFSDAMNWVTVSNKEGRKFTVANDDQGNAQSGVVPDADDPSHDAIRKNVLWGNPIAGGAVVVYYYGCSFPDSDLTCEDFRSRNTMWMLSWYTLAFLMMHVPFWSMTNRNDLVSSNGAWYLSNEDVLVVYLLNGASTCIDLPIGSYIVS
jgi:hypothetical protein